MIAKAKRKKMTERFWTPERKKHYYKLAAKEEHRREYMRKYMQRERAKGTLSTGGSTWLRRRRNEKN